MACILQFIKNNSRILLSLAFKHLTTEILKDVMINIPYPCPFALLKCHLSELGHVSPGKFGKDMQMSLARDNAVETEPTHITYPLFLMMYF